MKKSILLLSAFALLGAQPLSAKRVDMDSDYSEATINETMYPSLEEHAAIAKGSLQPAQRDLKEANTAVQTNMMGKATLSELEATAQDAVERTKELAPNHPARKAAMDLQAFVKTAKKSAENTHGRLADTIQNTKNQAHKAAESIKSDLQIAHEKRDAFIRALEQVRNPHA